MSAAPPMEASMVCMTVVEDGPSIAFACYDEERNEILLEAVHASDDTECVVERFLQTARPNLVLINNKIVNNPYFLEMITRPPTELPGEQQNASSQVREVTQDETEQGMRPSTQALPYRLLKSSTFDIRACRMVILQKLRITSLLRQRAREHAVGYEDPNRSERTFQRNGSEPEAFQPSSYHSLAAVVNFDSKVEVQALGALVSYLQSSNFRLSVDGTVTINRIVQAKSCMYMKISASTFSALHIFSTEHHPLIAKGPGNAKEGFSLYSLLDRTQSKGGRQLLREWMAKPLVDLKAIQERQDAVEVFLQPQLQTFTGVLLSQLRRVGAVDKILTRMQKCGTQPADFLVLTKTFAAGVAISNTLQSALLPLLEQTDDESHQFLLGISQRCHTSVLRQLEQQIVDTVDCELTAETKTEAIIRRGFHEELDEKKDQQDMLADIMAEVGYTINEKHPELELSVVFVSQIGFHVALDRPMVMSHAIEVPHDFQHIFNQDDMAYFKTREMEDLDENIGDLYGLIRDMESMIIAELEEDLLESECELRESFKALSELDCILSFANCADDHGFSRPRMVEASKNRIHIKDGRHPLQEIITERDFVPNDVRIDQEQRINVITGPNFSGKSCYLRQVGVLVYMAQIGSFIPCKEAEISIVDQICANISTVETCAVPQSSFQLDLTQMASIFLRCTSGSLVLVDEFGKGTSPASGLAVLGAALKKLSIIGCKTVCTTHFMELFSMNVIQDQSDGVKARQMEIHLPQENETEAAPLFKLIDGVASSSAGLICAKKAGLHPYITERAKAIVQNIREQKGIDPVKDALLQEFEPNENQILVLQKFLLVKDWADATDSDMRDLLQKLAHIEE